MRTFVVLPLLLLASASGAQPLTTDRPSVTESSQAMEPSRVQVELGTTFEVGASGNPLVFNAPEALVRIGVFSFAEVRLGVPNYVRVYRAGGDLLTDGTDDPTIGLKLELPSLAGIDFAFLPSTTIPIEDDTPGESNVVRDRFGANRLQPSFLFLASNDLTPQLSIGTQGGITYLGPGLDGAELAGSLVLGFALDEQIGLFAEVVATDIVSADRMAEVLVHGGATLLLTDDLQLDAHGGAGITDSAPDFLVGIGASARF